MVVANTNSGSDEDPCLLVGTKRSAHTQDELREACVLTSKLLPPRVFAKAVKTMIMQAQLLRGKALSAMQDEIKGVVSMATDEREARAKRGRCAQNEDRGAPGPRQGSGGPLSLFLATPTAEDEDYCWDLEDLDRGILGANQAEKGSGMSERAGKEEPVDDGFVEGVFAPSCLSCGWPLRVQGTCCADEGTGRA